MTRGANDRRTCTSFAIVTRSSASMKSSPPRNARPRIPRAGRDMLRVDEKEMVAALLNGLIGSSSPTAVPPTPPNISNCSRSHYCSASRLTCTTTRTMCS